MILVGNQRGGGRDLALHLIKDENERVTVHQIRGFAANDLMGAFLESYAISKATRCKQHLYSLSLNPPKDVDVSEAEFEAAIDKAEARLGLTGQPRAIVFHEKRGADGILRRHAHAVWCRVNTDLMKAIHLSHDHRKLETLSRQLFIEHGWKLPPGHMNKADRDPLNYGFAEHQQAKRAGKNAQDIKKVFQSAWAASDSRNAFATALNEHGYILAKGDRRGFVAVDADGEVYAVARYVGVRTKEVRARLGELDGLPSVNEAQALARDVSPDRAQSPAKAISPAARKVRQDPEHVLSLITEKESTFTRADIAKTLNAYIDDAETYRAAYAKVLSSKQLVALDVEANDASGKVLYSTREMINLERTLIVDAGQMAKRSGFAVPGKHIRNAMREQDKTIREAFGGSLSREQRAAIEHITGDKQLACVIGVAGAGKSTMLAAARDAWERSGHRVIGTALAGKAAEGLEVSSGIPSRTLASYELAWKNDVHTLQKGDVLVIDEAGMIGSRQMARFVTEAKTKGVKLVLVGDAEQLQPIEAGAPFRSITERQEPARLSGVHRQKQDWQKRASGQFALGRTKDALAAYVKHGGIQQAETPDDAVKALVRDYMKDGAPGGSQLALAHRRADVRAINTAIREARQAAGDLRGEIGYTTTHGERAFASGDRILFTRNDRQLGVKNGMLGTVTKAGKNRLDIALDDRDGRKESVRISLREYADIDHGYAATIHKSQGATVDRSYVLASRSMDRHLTYVAMTRHKHSARLYSDKEEFKSLDHMQRVLGRLRQKQSTLDRATETPKANKNRNKAENQRQAVRPGSIRRFFSGVLDRLTGKQPAVPERTIAAASSRVRNNVEQTVTKEARPTTLPVTAKPSGAPDLAKAFQSAAPDQEREARREAYISREQERATNRSHERDRSGPSPGR